VVAHSDIGPKRRPGDNSGDRQRNFLTAGVWLYLSPKRLHLGPGVQGRPAGAAVQPLGAFSAYLASAAEMPIPAFQSRDRQGAVFAMTGNNPHSACRTALALANLERLNELGHPQQFRWSHFTGNASGLSRNGPPHFTSKRETAYGHRGLGARARRAVCGR
jgi:hypothetical protein